MSDQTFHKGDRWDFTIAVIDGNLAAFDLTGATVWVTVKEQFSDGDPGVLQVNSTDPELVITDAPGGVVTVALKKDKTTIAAKKYEYDVQVEKAGWDGPITTQRGAFHVTDEVTRAALP